MTKVILLLAAALTLAGCLEKKSDPAGDSARQLRELGSCSDCGKHAVNPFGDGKPNK